MCVCANRGSQSEEPRACGNSGNNDRERERETWQTETMSEVFRDKKTQR